LGKRKTLFSRYPVLGGLLETGLFFALLLCLVVFGLRRTDASLASHGIRLAEEAVRRAAVSCYALEGAYPESYDYLREHYGLRVNEALYAVNYQVFASNIMPEITVVRR